MARARVFHLHDPLDRWVRVTVLAETYAEPLSSLWEFIESSRIELRWRGTIAYVNERRYQDAIEALPHEKTRKPRRDSRVAAEREVQVPGDGGRRARLRPLDADAKQGARVLP